MKKMEFLEEIPIHVPNTLQQLLGRFQTVRDGLPELIKNAKDQYSRLGIMDRTERAIVVLVDSSERRIGVLDFAGATSEDFLLWRKWSDPYANRAATAHDIEGGHGNGGKGFMVRGSTKDSFFESCRDGLRTKMGYENGDSERLFYPAFFVEERKRIDNVKIDGARKHLDLVLAGIGATHGSLPDSARATLEKSNAFSIVQVNGVRDWMGRRATARQVIASLADEMMNHPQAALSIETCSVFFVIDGKSISSVPLERAYPEPMPGFESLAALVVPSKLNDPQTSEEIDTGSSGDGSHFLQLRTSRQSLRMANNKPLNVVRVRNARNVVGNWSVADMHSRAESAFIFGELRVPSLGSEHQVGADRVDLADTQLVRALHGWVSEQVAELAGKIQRAVAKEHKPQELDKANDGLRKMREIMRTFLEQTSTGKGGGRKGGKGHEDNGEPDETEENVKPTGTIVRQIVLEGGAQSIAIARGTTVPLVVRAYDLSAAGDKLTVKGAQLDLIQDPPNMASLVGRRTLRADTLGRSYIWFRDRVSGVESNRVEVEIVQATGAEMQELPSRLLLQGEEVPLRVSFKTARGARTDLLVEARADLVVDAEVDEPLMGRVDRYGVFTAGGHEGVATVRVRFGAGPSDTCTGILQVGPNRVPQPSRKVGTDGGDVPIILLCGVEAPGMEQYPPDQRTIVPSEQWPTIIDYEPPFEPDTIFINQDSKECRQVRSGRGGRRGVAGIGTETFLQFLALKCFEILKRLYVRQSVKDGATTELQFRQAFAEAEMQCAPFVDHAFEIAHEIAGAARETE
jgi:hypothetical protein